MLCIVEIFDVDTDLGYTFRNICSNIFVTLIHIEQNVSRILTNQIETMTYSYVKWKQTYTNVMVQT